MKVLRSLIAAPLSCAVLLLLVFAVIDQAGLKLYPLPDGMQIGTTPMAEIIASRPLAAMLFNGVLRLPAVFLSAWLAARIAPAHGRWHGTAVGVAFAGLVVVSGLFAPFPLWATVLSVLVFPLLGYFGGRVGEGAL